jgi:hypothetical protein
MTEISLLSMAFAEHGSQATGSLATQFRSSLTRSTDWLNGVFAQIFYRRRAMYDISQAIEGLSALCAPIAAFVISALILKVKRYLICKMAKKILVPTSGLYKFILS